LADFTDKPFSLVGPIRRFTDKSRKRFSGPRRKSRQKIGLTFPIPNNYKSIFDDKTSLIFVDKTTFS